jgi:hypothetical protein
MSILSKAMGGLGGAAQGAATGFMVSGGNPLGAIAGGALGGIGGLLAAADQEKDQKKADALRQRAAEEIAKIPTPELKFQAYEELKSAGYFTPELEKEIKIADSEYEKISTDPRLKEAQMGALASLQELAKSGGLDAMDRANLEQARRRAALDSANQQAAVQESMARRGMGGSGLEMVQRQMAAQSAANQANAADLQIQGEARRRALEAIQQSGQLAGNVREQDFGEQAKIAAAKDELNRFRAQNAINMQMRNIGSMNEAQLQNLKEKQRILDANVASRNAGMDLQRSIAQKNYENQLNKAAAQGGVYREQAGAADRSAQQTGQMWGGLMQGIGQLGTAYASTKKPTKEEDFSASQDF